MKLKFPFKDASTGGGSFSLRHKAGGLQRDGERGVGERVGGSESGERHRGRHGLIELTGIPKSANQAVMGLNVCGIGCDGCAKRVGGLTGRAGCKQSQAFFRKRCGGLWIGCGHGSL